MLKTFIEKGKIKNYLAIVNACRRSENSHKKVPMDHHVITILALKNIKDKDNKYLDRIEKLNDEKAIVLSTKKNCLALFGNKGVLFSELFYDAIYRWVENNDDESSIFTVADAIRDTNKIMSEYGQEAEFSSNEAKEYNIPIAVK